MSDKSVEQAKVEEKQLLAVPPVAHEREIIIQGWTVKATKLPILNAQESNEATASLNLPLPEICFGNNTLEVSNPHSGINFIWDTLGALKEVGSTSDVKVAYAEEWARGQAASGTQQDLFVQKPYDWTYTTVHPGRIAESQRLNGDSNAQPTDKSPTAQTLQNLGYEPAPQGHPGIPLRELARQDVPIMFYEEIPLFEDELGDNGIAELVVRVRVNMKCIFVLSRFFLRVDRVLFRTFETRTYVQYDKAEVIRERKGRQASYEEIKKKLPADKPNDLTPLTDPNWVSAAIEEVAKDPSTMSTARFDTGHLPSSMKALHLSAETLPSWEGEGKSLEVLKLPLVSSLKAKHDG